MREIISGIQLFVQCYLLRGKLSTAGPRYNSYQYRQPEKSRKPKIFFCFGNVGLPIYHAYQKKRRTWSFIDKTD